MRFSDYFEISRSQADTWFDPVLSIDTRLFIDPFLIYARETGQFRGSHRSIIKFFNVVFKLIATTHGKKDSPLYLKATELLIFPEREELCLGYTQGGTKGSGSGRDLANVIASAVWEAIQAGITEIKHFEEVSILREGIGADRISDITAGLLLNRLADYTARICRSHNIPLKTTRYSRGVYDAKNRKWLPLKVNLPSNPYNDKPILLVPEDYLDTLPTINPEDFWDYCYDGRNELLRSEFSYDVTRRVSKHEIIKLARKHPELVTKYVGVKEKRRPRPYNIKRDEKGLVRWYEASKQYVAANPVTTEIDSQNAFTQTIRLFVEEYRHFVEENAGWRLLWNDNQTSKSEEVAQLLFLGVVKHYCHANNIDIAPETNIGRGAVDFKISQGYQYRALLELKLAHNTKFWRGLRKQLPAYMQAERVKTGYFIVVLYTDNDFDRVSGIRRAVRKTNKQFGGEIAVVLVDARSAKLSASKL